MTYRRITDEERRLIYQWRQSGSSNAEIARLLGRNKSAIGREIKRNSGERGYRHKQAHSNAQERAKRSGPRRFTPEVIAYVEVRLRRGWTPEAISGRAKHEGVSCVGKDRIYQHVYDDANCGGDLWENLPRSGRKRRRRAPRSDRRKRGKIPNQRMIDERPAEVETRETAGNWEGDLIQGAAGTGHLVTLVERKFRFTLVGQTKTKEADPVRKEICSLFSAIPDKLCESLTLDNGKEFSFHEKISEKTKMDVYFAHPYSSWERGTNENTNGRIRRLYPKKSSFAEIGTAELKHIDRFLNDRPMKCLDWHTPREKLNAFIAEAP